MRILLVEDHSDTSEVMARMLEKCGHLVTSVTTAREAERLCKPGMFEVMICDIMLPDRDGWSLGAIGQQCGIPAIALTALALKSDISKSKAEGFARHLSKPVDFTTLEAAIREVTKPNEPNKKV